MKFKLEISLLLAAIILYALSAFCYSYEASSENLLPVLTNPYRIYAFPLTALASALLAIAAILYSKRK